MARKSQEREAPNASTFPKMGESIPHGLINVSGNRSPYTQLQPKKTMGRGASPTGKAAVRGRTQISEANGPQFHVSTTLYKANSAEASKTLRNTSMMPAAITRPDHVGSASDFWTKRMFGQKL